MKQILKVAFLACLLAFSYSIFASEWNDRISVYLEAYDLSKEDPKPIAYPQLRQKIENTFFQYDRNYIRLDAYENGEVIGTTEFYYGEDDVVIDSQTGWNLVTQGDYVYEWESGKSTGIKIARNDAELVDYILYSTDVSYFMTGVYNEYKTKPQDFDVIEHSSQPYVELIWKKPQAFVEAIFVDVNSLWFYGFRIAKRDKDFVRTFRISLPQKSAPTYEHIHEEFDSITFEESNTTLRRHMVYL